LIIILKFHIIVYKWILLYNTS